jgi:propionyl-CoA carboxylase alpha chain/3-methylcrotonyl-CoA carboxylase alpha subunit
MPGRIVSVSVQAGQAVKRGEVVIAVEAMKMEHALLAPFDGIIAELQVVVGDQVAENVLLARVARPAGD